jgi:hypothetical protein
MSWMPSADPILGDKRSCDTLELVVVPRVSSGVETDFPSP